MREVTIKNTKIGKGSVKVCVPITGKNCREIEKQIKNALGHHPDLLEWRADFYEGLFHEKDLFQAGEILKENAGEIPVIFTVRTKNEGGEVSVQAEEYEAVLRQACNIDAVHIIDLEIFMNGLDVDRMIGDIHQAGKYVIASSHHFHQTPSCREMEEIFAYMETKNADIRKLAVMPQTDLDVIELMRASCLACSRGERPVAAMSMGDRGKITRAAGKITGSCITFATAGVSSAPGQMTVEHVRKVMGLL